ncbi:GNAT family N-acetyltransferase [Aestuariivivens sediminicola]|uniref:GNAT family N-acetyltransferase n=1 Tax=Aestuariivivens sediminicola TaxID=2913560 RepID=UPI001F5638B7|nr:GNAT family N-acetyltransferase [Aestuariivivens sediminicola]
MTDYKTFETNRLILKPLTEEDAEFLLSIYNSHTWLEYVGDRNMRTVKDTREHIKKNIVSQLTRLGYSCYTITLKDCNTMVGISGLFDREGVNGIDIGFALLPEHEKKGYAFESAQRLLEAGFKDFNLKEIYGITKNKNKSSKQLLEKLGMHCEKTIKLPDKPTKYLMFKISSKNRRAYPLITI